tara:strand:- start:585 stop:851 length:267 start_codon:yes stop_codon:yes gene_type:complete
MEKVKTKIRENSVIIFLLIALSASQIITFVRLHQQDKVIHELARTNTVLFELCRLQTELTKLDILEEEIKKELEKGRGTYREWKFNEI